jgi:TetR/AcrR family transcriptional regulator
MMTPISADAGGMTFFLEKHYKDAFDKISEDKRRRIIEAAIAEFSDKGFVAANINVIAKNAGISIGSMYNYFDSKESLFLTIVDYGYAVLEGVIASIDLEKGNIFDKFELLVRAAQQFSKAHPELIRIYLDSASSGLGHLSERLSRQVESITAEFYRGLIAEAKAAGLVARDIDAHAAAFCIDNLILLMQYSYTSGYFRERMKIFAGDDALENDEKIVAGIMRFIRGGLGA